MSEPKQRIAFKEFVANWTGKGYEKGQSQPFWIQLLRGLGVENPEQYISFEEQVHLDHTSFIDGYIDKTHVMIEQKSIEKSLTQAIKQSDGSLLNPFQQAKRYITELPLSKHPRWVITSNFKEFYIYDMEKPHGEPEIIKLEDLEKEYYRLSFLLDSDDSHIRKEMEVSIKAGEIVGLIYDALLKQYKNPDSEETLKSLNKLCVRLVFCLYAEDAGIFGKHDMFLDYMKQFETKHFRSALIKLFEVLNTKIEDRDPYLDEDLARFPYVNGGLFADEHIEIPNYTDEIRELLLTKASADFDWSEISPTIFGAVFESTLNPETRRKGGMHYTSIENIHKVIDPLFMDELNKEFDEICENKVEKTRNDKLKIFQEKIANLTFLDPACGSGNFLTETYISLRKLENKILKTIQKGQITIGAITNPIKVSIQQFYGIEINDFAVTVAKTALWIAESQMMKQTEDIVHMDLDFLPLKTYNNIFEGNALRIDWEDVVPKYKLNYIMGNPPFVGARLMSPEQKEDLLNTFGKKWKNAGNLDFVSCWYKKAVDYITETPAPLTHYSPLVGESKSLILGENNISPSPLVGEGWGEGSIKATHFYTKQALEYSKELRKNMTPAEGILWHYLRNRQLNNLKFRRQEAFDKYILDFVCYEYKLVIELDGGGHLEEEQKLHDIERDNFITKQGFKVIRIYNSDVFNNIEGVIEYIILNINTTNNSLLAGESKSLISVRGNNVSGLTPHPSPLPQGAREPVKCAFVSTNSICQGEQVAILWKPLFEQGINIDFAHTTFRWDSEATLKAHVHCIIVGFSCKNKKEKYLYSNDRVQIVDNINGYLVNAPNVFIENRTKQICNAPELNFGSMPNDGGFLLITEEEKNDYINKYPILNKYIKQIKGAIEFIQNKKLYCFWFVELIPSDIKNIPEIKNILENIRACRLKSNRMATKKMADFPTLFAEIRQPKTEYIAIPKVSSEKRKYIPIGYENPDIIAKDQLFILPDATIYNFGILTSNVHNAWLRAVCGRMKSDYNYSKGLVYNNFPWCETTDEQKAKIEHTAQGILDARELYPDCSLADLYDDLTMPPELRKAHQLNDIAVMEAYGFYTRDENNKCKWFTESETVARLMEMYQKLTEK